MTKIFIDGAEGTTGLRIRERLQFRNEFKVVTLPEDLRKDVNARQACINDSDITVLCLPDAAAKEAVLLANNNVRIVDASTAHRTENNWVYGFSELDDSFEKAIAFGNRIAVPGCHASGVLALIYPLIKAGIFDASSMLSAASLTGYSGGGKSMIKDYEDINNAEMLKAPRMYALSQEHKHLKEIVKISGLKSAPVFNPIVCNFYSGMLVSIGIKPEHLNGIKNRVALVDFYKEYYKNKPLISVFNQNDGMISANKLSGKDNMELIISGNDDRLTLNAVYDNLGKGASGACVECINIMLGLDAITGLII